MTSVVHASARIGEGTTLGEFCVIGANVVIGAGCKLGHHVVIHEDTVVGNTVRIDDHASLGKRPMKAANSATTKDQELPPLTVGELRIVGTGDVLYRGAAVDAKVLMADLATIRENVTIGRGTIVGTATFGGVISTGGFGLIDGTSVRQPFRGWYLPQKDGSVMDLENNGTIPDVSVPQTPMDEASGADRQLEAAVRELLERIDQGAR